MMRGDTLTAGISRFHGCCSFSTYMNTECAPIYSLPDYGKELSVRIHVLIGGDIILEVNSIPFVDEDAFDRMSASLNSLKPGDKLISKVMRAGRVIELSTTITGR